MAPTPKRYVEEKDGGTDTLWYMAGPDDYILHLPANVEKIRIATVVSRHEEGPLGEGQQRAGKPIRIVAHPDSPIEFETSERVEIDLRGSDGDDIMIGPKHGAATFYGGAGNGPPDRQGQTGQPPPRLLRRSGQRHAARRAGARHARRRHRR